MNAHTGFASRIASWFSAPDAEQKKEQGGREATRNGSAREIERRRALFADIGAFLFAHDLDLTPVNFGLALDYLTENNMEITSKVRALLNERKPITNAIAEEIVSQATQAEMTAGDLSAMLSKMEDGLKQFASLAKESSASVTHYGDALKEHVATMDDEVANQPLLSTLVSLTHTMVERSRQIEGRMQDSQKRTRALQQSLEVARKAAEQDHLTGLPNRRAFESRMKEEIAEAQATGAKLCVAICDIDHFKNINDTHGHDTGDRVLKFVASLLAKVSGEKCHVARHGGEEFVMLFRDKSLSEAAKIIDETRADLASRNLVDRNTGDRMAQISFSGGVADVFAYDEPGMALKAADRALYSAKEHGRNRIYIAED